MFVVFVFSNVEGFGLEAEARMTTWHINMSTENVADCSPSHDASEGPFYTKMTQYLVDFQRFIYLTIIFLSPQADSCS